MNFSKIISWLIPQGKVKSLSINGNKVWQDEIIIKAGTYYFKSSLTPLSSTSESLVQEMDFSIVYLNNGVEYPIDCNKIQFSYVANENAWALRYYDFSLYPYTSTEGWRTDGLRYITVNQDTTVSAEFSVWFNANIEALPQLPAPTISLDGDILSITDTSGLATSFDILVDGVVKGSVEVEQETTYTIPAGGWEFYETPNFPTTDILQKDISFYVTYNGSHQKQTVLSITSDSRIVVGSGTTMDAELYSNGEWQLDFNLSITFDSNQTVSKKFYDWFYNNAFLRSGGAN